MSDALGGLAVLGYIAASPFLLLYHGAKFVIEAAGSSGTGVGTGGGEFLHAAAKVGEGALKGIEAAGRVTGELADAYVQSGIWIGPSDVTWGVGESESEKPKPFSPHESFIEKDLEMYGYNKKK